MSETVQNGSTALVSVQIQEAVERALQDVQQFIDSDQAKEKMQYVLVRQVAENTELQRCSPESFALAVYEMFKLGLDPRGQNEVWMIPYKGKAKAQTGYAGKRKLALNDARVDDVFAKAVHQNDTYELDPRTGQPLHTYSPFKPRGAIIGYYGAVRYKNGSWHTEEMDVPAMRTWKDTFSRAAQKAVWAEDRGTDGLKPCSFDGMALKTMLSRICHTKHMSLSPEAQEAFALDDTLYGRTKDVTPEPSTYVPTHEEHVQNGKDAFGEQPASPEYYAPLPTPHKEGLGLTSKRLAEGHDGPLATPPVKSVEKIREEAGEIVQAAAAMCGATSGEIWDDVKALVPKKPQFQLQRQQDLDTVKSLLETVIASRVKLPSAPEPEEDTSWEPEAELLSWLDAEAGRRGVEPVALRDILTEYALGWEESLATYPASQVAPWKVWAAKRFDTYANQVKEEAEQSEEGLTVDAPVATV